MGVTLEEATTRLARQLRDFADRRVGALGMRPWLDSEPGELARLVTEEVAPQLAERVCEPSRAADALELLGRFLGQHIDDTPPRAATQLRGTHRDGAEVSLRWTTEGFHYAEVQHPTAEQARDLLVQRDPDAQLRGALNRYVDQQLLALDQLSESEDPALEVKRAAAVRAAGHRIVDRLARIEELQRHLFLKRKLVLRTDWLLSVDLLPKQLRRDIADVPDQRSQWAEVYGEAPLQPGYVADTATLPPSLRRRVRHSLDALSTPCTHGEVILGENLQALRLLEPRLAGRVQVTCVDPPYNTGGDKFVYRDAYRHAAWLSMMRDRLALARRLSSRDGALAISIDDAEMHRLAELAREVWGPELAKLVWERNRKNDARFFSVGHEYMLVHAADLDHLRATGRRYREPKEGLDEARAHFESLRRKHAEDWDAVRKGWLAWFDRVPVADPRRRMRRFTRVGPRGPFRDDGDVSWPGGGGPRYEVLHPVTGKAVRIPSRGWVYPDPARFWEAVESGRVVFGEDESTSPRVARYLFDAKEQVMPSVFYSYAQTTAQEFDAMFGTRVFTHPKPWRDLARVIRYLGSPDCTVLDFFAGSGSTGHAVMALNRRDRGERRFVLMEVGSHGETVLLPRLQKAALADKWSKGRPVDLSPTPVAIKVRRLESHGTVLDNLGEAPDAAVHNDESALRYVLDAATDRPTLHPPLFLRPWSSTLVLREPAGHRTVAVDLVETFNELLGLEAPSEQPVDDGLVLVEGRDPQGARIRVVWCERGVWPDARLAEVLRPHFGPGFEPDRLYINGGASLDELRRGRETWTTQSLEESFRARLFETSDMP